MQKAYSLALSCLMCMSLVVFNVGCTSSQTANVVNVVSTQIPLALASASAISKLSGDPQLGAIFQQASSAVAADAPIIRAAIAAWKANASATNLQKISAAVNVVASAVNQQVLAANQIAGNSQDEQIALLSLLSLSAILNGMAASLSSVNSVKAASLPQGFREVVALTPRADINQVAKAYGVSPELMSGF